MEKITFFRIRYPPIFLSLSQNKILIKLIGQINVAAVTSMSTRQNNMISRLYWSGKKLLQKKQSFSYRITTHKKIYSTLLLKMKKQNDTFKLCFGFRLVFF